MIFVIAEHKDKKLKPITNELVVFAQRVGRDFGQPITIVVFGSGTTNLVDELKTRKVDRILVADDPALSEYTPDRYVHLLKKILSENKPFLAITGQSTQGLDFMPRLAVSLRRPLIAACVEYEKHGERLVLTRQVFNAKMNMKTIPRGD